MSQGPSKPGLGAEEEMFLIGKADTRHPTPYHAPNGMMAKAPAPAGSPLLLLLLAFFSLLMWHKQ